MDTVTTTAAIRLSDLPNDNIIEILTWVPDAVSLFRCTVVCKRWRDIVSHPAFLHRRFGDLCPAGGGVPSLLGFFVQRHLVSTNARSKVIRNTPSWAPIFVPAPGSALGPTRRFLTFFLVPGDGNGNGTRVLNDAKPLVARDGLVLLRLLPAKFRENKAVLRLCVCDLLTGKHNLLPPIDDIAVFGGDGAIGYAVLRSAAAAGDGRRRPADGYSTLFRVLIVGVHHLDGRVYIGEVSSDADAPAEPFWAAIGGELLVTNGRLRGCRRAAAAVGGGAATWLFHGEGDNNVVPDDGHHEQNLHAILCVRTDTGRVCASRLVPFVEDCSAWQLDVDDEGKFSLLIVGDRRLAILTNKDADGPVAWRPIHGVHNNNNGGGADDRELSGIEPVCVAEKSGAMLVLYRSDPDNAYLIDIHSGSRTVVAAGKRSLNYATAVPCEIDLVQFFMARLGVQAAAPDPKAA